MLLFVNLIMFYTAYCVQDVDSYIHRSGRTGRAGRPGISVVLYQSSEMDDLSTVERVAVSSCTDANVCSYVLTDGSDHLTWCILRRDTASVCH